MRWTSTGWWLAWAAQFGGPAVRPMAVGVARRQYLGVQERDTPWTWVADWDGRMVGMSTVTPPEWAGWVAGLSSASTPAYVGTTVVSAPF